MIIALKIISWILFLRKQSSQMMASFKHQIEIYKRGISSEKLIDNSSRPIFNHNVTEGTIRHI